MDFRQTLTCERIVLIRRLCVRLHFRLMTRYARLYPRCAIFFHGRPCVRFRNELYSGANTRVSRFVAVIENDTPNSAGNQRTWHTITGNIAKQFDTLPLMSDDAGRGSFFQVAFQDIVVLLSFCKIIPVNLSSMLKNRGNFHATKGICHHIVTPLIYFKLVQSDAISLR